MSLSSLKFGSTAICLFSSTDLFIIIGNTLDNAIEACSQIDDKKERIVSVWLYQKNHLLLYEISNPYNEKAQKKPVRYTDTG